METFDLEAANKEIEEMRERARKTRKENPHKEMAFFSFIPTSANRVRFVYLGEKLVSFSQD